MKIFAHRGYRAIYPENTMLAFRKAAEFPIYGIELDVQLTRDGEIVIIHDETLDRTTSGSGFVCDVDFDTLRTYDAGFGERVPALGEYFDFVRDLSIVTNIEFKNSVIAYDGLEEKVLRLVREYKLSDRLIFSSFKLDSVRKLRGLAPEIPAGFIVSEICDINGLSAAMREYGIEYLNPSVSCYMLNKAAIQGENLSANIWTVNDEAQLQKLITYGVNGIFTDNPALIKYL